MRRTGCDFVVTGEAELKRLSLCGPPTVIPAVRKPLVLLSDPKQFLTNMFDRLSFGHAAGLSASRSYWRPLLGGLPWKLHFQVIGCRLGKGALLEKGR